MTSSLMSRIPTEIRIAKYFPTLNKGHGSRHGRYVIEETDNLSPEICNNPLCELNVRGKGGLRHRSDRFDKAINWLKERK